MTATVKVILDSISPEGIRLPTLQLRYPRMVHADFLTHRVFTRNGRSSRAVPVHKLLTEAPYVPHFLRNQPGMVAMEEFSPEKLEELQENWLEFAKLTQDFCRYLSEEQVHKQWANRPLEWFGYIDVLLSTTDIANFMALRDEAGAQPEIQDIAKEINKALAASEPKLLQPGEWHMPYIDASDYSVAEEFIRENRAIQTFDVDPAETLEVLKKVSVARCARLTIRPFDGDASIEKEVARYEKLMVSQPVHASPAEHIATPDGIWQTPYPRWANPTQHGNFYGWRQMRKQIENNTIWDKR